MLVKMFVQESMNNLKGSKTRKQSSNRHHTDVDNIKMEHLWMLREVNIVGENIETIREKDKPEYKKYPSQDSYSLYSESSKKIRQ